jgi:ATP-binding cassette subfamily F protein 3
MIAIVINSLNFTHASELLFENLSWEIHSNRCVGLVGANGSGKTTLLRVIAGDLQGDAGNISRPRGITIGYMPQEINLPPGQTVLEIGLASSNDLTQVEAELDQIEVELSKPSVYNDDLVLSRFLEKQALLLEQYADLGGPGYEGYVRSILKDIGFDESEQLLPVEHLSGGQKKLLFLAQLIIQNPDLLLLDEPDNHLDLDGKGHLEKLIRNFDGGVILVSHDRYLLDLLSDEIAELENGKLTLYSGNYSVFAYEKHNALIRQQQLYQAQQKEIQRLELSAKRLLTWGKVYDNNKFIRRGQNILKRLDRIERIEKPALNQRGMGLNLSGWRGSEKVLEISKLTKVFPGQSNQKEEKVILNDIDVFIRHGERVGLVGPNGAGKSLLFRLISGEDQPTSGEIIIGPSVKIGYYTQEHQNLNYQDSLIDTIRKAAPLSESQTVAFLNRFLFSYDQQRGSVGQLSGGERSRLQIALLMISQPNFLLLDEPTNNLDIQSTEILEDAIADFEGTVLVISHDRYFLDRVVDRILELDRVRLNKFTGSYSDFLTTKFSTLSK